MNETQIIDELHAALDDAAATVGLPAGAAERASGRARRRRLTHGLAAVVPAAGLAAALLVVLGGQPASVGTPAGNSAGTHAPLPKAAPGAQHPRTLTVDYVTSRASAAARDLSNVIVKTTTNDTVTWSDSTIRAVRYKVFWRGGKLASDELETFTGGVIKPPAAIGQLRHRVYVDYTSKTWWRLTDKTGTLKDIPLSGSLPVPENDSHGVVTILGHRKLAGKDTILVKYAPPRGFKPTKSTLWSTEYVWLDATSYLIVQTKIYGLGPVEKLDFAYLSPTPANLARFKLTPPSGFKQVAPPPFRGDGQPGLGQIP